MPAVGPYGIEQFDAAGVIGNYLAAKENRIRSMILQKQLEAQDRAEARQAGVDKAVSAYLAGEDAASSPSAAGAVQPTPAATRQPNAAAREKLIRTLIAIDPERVGQFIDVFSKMDEAQANQFKQRNTRIMQIAAGVLQLPPDQRPAAIQQAMPELKELGFNDQQLAGFDPSGQNLRGMIAGHMDMERIASFVKPNFMNVNGEVVDENALARGDSSPVRYRSEYIDTDQGLARRPGGGASGAVPPPPAIGEVRQGYRFEGGEPGDPKSWKKVGGPSASPTGGFPGD